MLDDLQVYAPGKTTPAKDMNTLGEAVRILRSIAGADFVVDAAGVYHRRPPNKVETIVARLTDFTTPSYDWKEVVPKADGTFVDVVGGRTSDDDGVAIDPSGANAFTADDTSGDVVTLRRQYDPDTGLPLWVILAGKSGLIPVLVSQVGGANGTQTTAATWTYDVTDVSSNAIASALSPTWARAVGKKVAASHGNGYYDPSGNFVLEQVDEVDDTGTC